MSKESAKPFRLSVQFFIEGESVHNFFRKRFQKIRKMESEKQSAIFGMIEERYGTNFSSFTDYDKYDKSANKMDLNKSALSKSQTRKGLLGTELEFHNNQLSEEEELGNTDSLQWWDPPEDSLPVEFFQDTSLHGLKYIGQPSRHISERIFWFLTFVAGLSTAIWLITEMWIKYQQNPMIVSFQPFETNVDQLPFPAVTVCNMNKVLRSKAEEYLEGTDTQQKQDAYYLDHVCSSTKSFATRFNFKQSGDEELINWRDQNQNFFSGEETSDTENLTLVNKFLRRAAQSCGDMIPYCIWQDQEEENCTVLFRDIETEYGKCCTFNMVPLSLLYTRRNVKGETADEIRQWEKWNLETEGVLLSNTPDQEFPRRQMKAGRTNGLSFLLNVNLKEYFCTSSDSVGFRLATHVPVELPQMADFGISVGPGTEVFVNVVPEITMADPDIFGFAVDKRNCYKAGEYPLKYFKYYTVNNCIDECVANDTKAECGCKRYYMPRSTTEPLCGPKKFECAENVKYNKTTGGIRNTCRYCLSSCTEIMYEPQTTTTPLKPDVFKFKNGGLANLNESDLSIVHVYISQDSFYAKVRKELYGPTDLFANTGGLMGLFLGFSGLSLVELIYFLTLRAWWKTRRRQNAVSEVAADKSPKWITSSFKKLDQHLANGRDNHDKKEPPSYHEQIFGNVSKIQLKLN